MTNIAINNKNSINAYQPTPTLFYDIEGVVVENKGKDIKIEKKIDDKIIQYALRLKEEMDAKIGETVKVDKEDIVSAKLEEKEELVQSEDKLRNKMDILKELGLEYTEENLRMIENLINSGIPISKDSVDSYIKSKECLSGIIENIDSSSFVKLMERGIDLEDENLQNLAEILETIKNEKDPFSLKRFLKLEKDITYKEAEIIAKEIYGQKMGKDVYDTIIALDKEGLPITKENIDKTTEAMAKLYDLKNIEDETYVKIIDEEQVFNIDNLFKLKNSYTKSNIERNLTAEKFEGFTIGKETTIESLKEVLQSLNIENTMENISILREFIVNNMDMDKESYNKIMAMKNDVNELRELLDHGKVLRFIKDEIDPMKEDIHELVKSLKEGATIEEPLDTEKSEELMKNLESLGKIQDKDLLQLLKQGESFNLTSIKEILNTNVEKEITIEYKTLDRTSHLSNILNSLGESLSPDVISLTSSRNSDITLQNLYTSHNEIKERQESIAQIDKIQEKFIFDEYTKARNNLTTNMVKESIKDGRILEMMPLESLNKYMEKKINRYKEIDRVTREISSIKGKEDKILPMIIKNDLPMTLKEIKDINEFLNGNKGLTETLKSITDKDNKSYTDEFKEGIKLLQEKISGSVKDGDEKVKGEYKELISSLENSNNSSNNSKDHDKDRNQGKDYLEVQNKISNKDIVLQFPIESGDSFKDLNIIIPRTGKSIDKNNMSFAISLETENLGIVTMDLKVVGKEVFINLEEDGEVLKAKIQLLEEKLQNLGYTINMEAEPMAI